MPPYRPVIGKLTPFWCVTHVATFEGDVVWLSFVQYMVYPCLWLPFPPFVFTCKCCSSASSLSPLINQKSSAHLSSTVCPPGSFPVQVAFKTPQTMDAFAPFFMAVCVHTAMVRCINCIGKLSISLWCSTYLVRQRHRFCSDVSPALCLLSQYEPMTLLDPSFVSSVSCVITPTEAPAGSSLSSYI